PPRVLHPFPTRRSSDLATMVAKPFSGRLSDRLGRKPLIVAGLFLCAATLPAVPTLTSIWALTLVSGLFGLGVAIVTPSTTALVRSEEHTSELQSPDHLV